MRKCRFCGKEIQDTSRVCEHCGRELLPPVAIALVEPPRSLPIAPDPDLSTAPIARVTVVDIDMPFGSMVGFMVKWALAAIPAILILAGLAALLGFVFGLLVR
jgi:hypothetical protein